MYPSENLKRWAAAVLAAKESGQFRFASVAEDFVFELACVILTEPCTDYEKEFHDAT